jgi:Icc protein
VRVIDIRPRPVHKVRYRKVSGGNGRVVRAELGVWLAEAEGLPAALGWLLACSDLQGVELEPGRSRRPPELLGLVLADQLRPLCRRREVPALEELGVVLAGDLYVRLELDRRGGLGDVRDVWQAFGGCTRWVAGVAGNHDLLGPDARGRPCFDGEPGVSLLDGTVVERDGLRVGGVGGVVGNPARPNHRSLDDFLHAVDSVLALEPELLVLHQGPPPQAGGTRGIRELRGLLSGRPGLLVIFGHDPWKDALEELPGGTQLCNVHARAIVLARRSGA